MKTYRNKNAFTLIEMLAVIVILGILIALAIGVTDFVMTKAKRTDTLSTMKMVMTAVQV